MAAGLALFPGALAAQESEQWKIHEWGTFTALQDETGIRSAGSTPRTSRAPVLPPAEQRPPGSGGRPRPGFFKDAPRCHPDVILRLETPVIYFHPPKTAALRQGRPPRRVPRRLAHGVLPDAKVDAPGLKNMRFQYGRLTTPTQGSLDWTGLQVGKPGKFPETTTPSGSRRAT
jgi:hypothetical protein